MLKRMSQNWRELLLFAAIVSLAAFLRLYRLAELPPACTYDEAFNATEAQNVLRGDRAGRSFFARPDGRADGDIHNGSCIRLVWRKPVVAAAIVSALVGTVTVAAVYVLARQLTQAIELTKSFLLQSARLSLSILYWHVNFSRLGMEPIFLPLMLTVALAFLWVG